MNKMFWLLFIITLIKIDTIKSDCPPTKAWIKQLLDEAFIPGAAIIVINHNEIIYEEAIGYHSPLISEEEEQQAMNLSSSIFMLASISKTFIAVAAMQMVESHKLNLDTDINQYVLPQMKIVHPYFPNSTITIRHLLSHSSGIGLNLVEQFKFYLPGDSFTQTNLGDLIKNYLNKNESWLPIPPGNITFYSNVGAGLVALIIERVSGISFEEYIHKRILKVLDIDQKKASYRLSDFENNKKNLVDHYIHNASWLETFQKQMPQLNISRAGNLSDWIYFPFFSIGIYPAGLLRMSAHTLSLWFQSFLNNFPNLLHNSSSIEEMLHVSSQESYMNISSAKFGLIWTWQFYGSRYLVGHSGSVPGMAHLMLANEKRNLGIILLTNGDVTRQDSQTLNLVKIIYRLINQLFDCFEKL